MRRFTLILALVLMVAMPMMAERVTPETARKVAATFLSNNGAKATQLTDLSKDAGFSNLYIFNAEQGFVVMSADDCVKPILGYSFTGRFVAENLPENIKWWLQGYSDQIQNAIDNNLPAEASIKTTWHNLKSGTIAKETNEVAVEPLITTLWDQTYPYNYYCPTCSSGGNGGHVYTGCVATAMAQVLKYWNYPTIGNSSHTYTHSIYGEQTVNFGETAYDWENMPNSLYSNSSQPQIDAVATLIYHCGVAVDMNYGTGSSGAYSIDVPPAFINYFNFSSSTSYVSRDAYEDAQWIAFLKNELDEGRPLYYSGSNTNSGHAFVCDGYRTDNYFHFNWGWSGYDGSYGSTHGNNGYWAIGALSPGAGGSGSGSGTYNLSNAVLAWAEPVFSLTAPILSASISENVVTLTWNVIESAVSYDVYKDNTKIASNVTGLSYTDNDVSFGHHYDYYIRAISSETKSNPSNFVTIVNTYQNRIPQNPSASISISDNSVNLTWTEPLSKTMDMYYGIGQENSSYGSEVEEGTYWGQCYPAQTIDVFNGMAIDHVSIYLGYSGSYNLFLYKDNTSSETNLIASKAFEGVQGWNQIYLDSPIPLETTKDLWVVFHTSKSIHYPAFFGEYSGNNKEHAHYLWKSFSENIIYTLHSNTISWTIKIHLTDGTFTYNVYRDNALIAEQQPNNSYQDMNLTDGTHEYFIKTYANNWESEASDIVSVPYSTEHLISEATTIPDNLTLSGYNRYIIESTGILAVGGLLTCTNPDHLILENGAQLINDSENVQVTVKKAIQPFTEGNRDGWNLIASPVIESLDAEDIPGLLQNEYDLYAFNQSGTDAQGNAREWRNYKANSFATIDHKTGYLYANSDETTLSFVGTLTGATEPTELTFNDNAYFAGFNLIGNPYPCNAYIARPFYVLEYNNVSDSTKFVLGDNDTPIPPCAAVLVQAQTDEDVATFSKTAPSTSSKIAVRLNQADQKGATAIDQVRIMFQQQSQLAKYPQESSASMIYIPQNGKKLAVANAEGLTELPINLRTAKNGSYTLSFDTEKLDLNYLHLIDNITGDDVDLLSTPSYTFNANINHHDWRFRLVFASNCEDAVDDNVAFAYVSNGEIVIYQEGTLQIVDMTGRIIVSHSGRIQCVPTTGMALGVYVLRLINGDNVKTQKIVIE